MNFFWQSFSLQAPSWVWGVVGVAWSLGVLLAVVAVRQAVRKGSALRLEGVRLLLLGLVGVLLLRPEWVHSQREDSRPTVAILVDETGSMETRDALAEGGEKKVLTRAELRDELLGREAWEELAQRGEVEVVEHRFGQGEAGEGGTNLGEAIEALLSAQPRLKAAVLLTDGDWNEGVSPVVAAQEASRRGIGLYARVLGQQEALPDLDLVEINAPTYGIVGEKVQIPFSIRSFLPREVRVPVTLRSERGREVKKIVTLPPRSTTHESMLWLLEKEGSEVLTLSFPAQAGELLEDNNSRQFRLAARPESIRVLVVESQPRWEYRFIRNALSRDPGVEVDCLLFHPQLGMGDGPDYIQEFPSAQKNLQPYDVVFLGDVGVGEGELSEEQLALLRGLIENQASGLILMPGARGRQLSLLGTELGDLFPVEFETQESGGYREVAPCALELTEQGRNSLLTLIADNEEENPLVWKSLPGFSWCAPVSRAKAGTEILAVHAHRRNQNGRLPLLVTRRAGTGKVLFMGTDSAWRWRKGVEDLYHYRFWGQVARWMSYQRKMAAGDQVRLFFTPEHPRPGQRLTVRANAFDAHGAPLAEGVLETEWRGPDGQTQLLELAHQPGGWGTFEGQVQLKEPGSWEVEVRSKTPGVQLKTQLVVQEETREKVGRPARPEVLEELVRIAPGAVIGEGQLEAVLRQISALPEPVADLERLALWAHPVTFLLLLGLAGLFWVLRKRAGRI